MTAKEEFVHDLYLLGRGIAHSKSAVMYNAAYPALGVDWTYAPFDCPTPEEAAAFLRERRFLSINVTSPYKPLAMRSSDEQAASAYLAQGANLLVNKDGRLLAYNVDGIGCADYLARSGVSFEGAAVVVCGTGPTSLSILHACALAGAVRLVLVGRDAARSRAVLDGYRARYAELLRCGAGAPKVSCPETRDCMAVPATTAFEANDYAHARHDLCAADVIVDATPLGMNADDPAPFDTTLLSSRQAVMDVVYGHGETALVAAARAAGCRTFDGAGMLVGQAVASIETCFAANGRALTLPSGQLFDIMAAAAGFEC